MRTAARSGLHPLLLLFALAWLALLGLYASFTAEDAYIVYRYAENLVRGDGLVFNPGEHINALTSPLHALLSAGLYALSGASPAAAKLCGVVAVGVACAFAAASKRRSPPLQLLFAACVLLSPFVALWTVGGLETPLLLALVTAATLLAERCVTRGRRAERIALSLVLGLAFLTRFDSVVFSLPLLASVVWTQIERGPLRREGDLVQLVLPGLVPALAWLVFSRLYFDDFLPTSFYHKRPGFDLLRDNLEYTAQFWVLSGIAFLGAVALGLRWRALRRSLITPLSPAWFGAALGLAAVSAYGLTAATSHMMFSYRLFVPYLPAAVLLVLDLVPEPRAPGDARGRPGAGWVWIAAGVAALQLGLAAWVDRVSVNPGRIGEYQPVSRREYVAFMDVLERQADLIRRHWVQTGREGPPRIYVYAAGVVPYRLPEAHVLDGGLISYRHAYHGNGLVPPVTLSADYVMTLTPFLGPLERQLYEQPQRFQAISEVQLHFVGRDQVFGVHYNPRPTRWRLPRRIDAPADLRGARLEGQDLGGVHLRRADLTQARLAGADLRDADLRDARLARVDLRRADLAGARLAGSDLRGARLDDARGLTRRQLASACGDRRTRLPPGLTLPPCRR